MPTDQAMTRRPIEMARATSPAPRRSPTMAWAAMATASIVSAVTIHTWKATWWAATSTRPIRVATEVPIRNVPVSERFRTSNCALTVRSRPMDPNRGASDAWRRRTSRPIQVR